MIPMRRFRFWQFGDVVVEIPADCPATRPPARLEDVPADWPRTPAKPPTRDAR